MAELHFWKFRKLFPYQSNSQNFFKFYCHFLGRRERGVFPVPLAFAKKFSSFAHWLKNRGVLRGSGRGGLKGKHRFGDVCIVWRAKLLPKRDWSGGNTPRIDGNDCKASKLDKVLVVLARNDTKLSFDQSQPYEMSSQPIKKGYSAARVMKEREGPVRFTLVII